MDVQITPVSPIPDAQTITTKSLEIPEDVPDVTSELPPLEDATGTNVDILA